MIQKSCWAPWAAIATAKENCDPIHFLDWMNARYPKRRGVECYETEFLNLKQDTDSSLEYTIQKERMWKLANLDSNV